MTGIPNKRDLAVKDRFLFSLFLLKGTIYVNPDEHLWTLNSLTFKASKIKPSQLWRNGNKQQSLSLGWLQLHTRGIVWLHPAPPQWRQLLWTHRQMDGGQTHLRAPASNRSHLVTVLALSCPGQDCPGITVAGKGIRLGTHCYYLCFIMDANYSMSLWFYDTRKSHILPQFAPFLLPLVSSSEVTTQY